MFKQYRINRLVEDYTLECSELRAWRRNHSMADDKDWIVSNMVSCEREIARLELKIKRLGGSIDANS